MNAYHEAKCPQGHAWRWKTGTPFICPVCKQTMGPGRVGPLTKREREILALVAAGMSNAQIAGALFIEESTVEGHLHRIYRKLGVKTRVQAASYAWEHTITLDTLED